MNRELVAAFGGEAAMCQLDLPGIPLHLSEHVETDVIDAYSGLHPSLDRSRDLSRRGLEARRGNRAIL